jgi:hypothetical protein
MRILGSMAILVALSACVEDRSVTLNRLKLQCKNDYGFEYDAPEMAQCVMALDVNRNAAIAGGFQGMRQGFTNSTPSTVRIYDPNAWMSSMSPVTSPFNPPTMNYIPRNIW